MSNYLNARKKLLFAIATIKYIRLVMTNNKLITKDEIEAFTRMALPMEGEDKDSISDQVKLISGICSRDININSFVSVHGSLKMETKRRAFIDTDEVFKVSNIVELGKANPNGITISDNINVKEEFTIDNIMSHNFEASAQFTTLNLVEFNILSSTLIKIIDKIISENNIPLKTIETTLLNINSGIESKSSLEIEISHLIAVPIEINQMYYMCDEAILDKQTSSTIEISSLAKLYDNVEILPDSSSIIASNQVISLKDYLALGVYRYTLLRDIKNMDIGDYRNSTIFEAIYIEV